MIFGIVLWDRLQEINGFKVVTSNWLNFVEGGLLTLEITTLSVFFGMILGLIIALMKMSRFRPLSMIAVLYIDFFRGTPLLVQIMLFYFGILPIFFDAGPFLSGVIACSLNSAAYVAEIVRAGIQAVDRGQMEAARSLGMSGSQAMRYVILPQAYKIVIPPMINEFVMLLKDTSLLSVIAVMELAHRGKLLYSTTYEPAWVWGAVCVVYYIMTKTISMLGDWVERRLATE
ncbi:MAG: amino acid ABC transporter permease [Syntrophomonadaceae bacterium]|jgi:polar amino acid transport system permease protein|nr:amino acid ABC transporter permease [Syntrophomonadaceae bacterium]